MCVSFTGGKECEMNSNACVYVCMCVYVCVCGWIERYGILRVVMMVERESMCDKWRRRGRYLIMYMYIYLTQWYK